MGNITLLTEQAPTPLITKEATVPDASASGCTLTWDDSNYTLLWAVCKDGSIYAFTTEPTFTATVSGTYTVRAANEMGGLSAASESVVITDDMITGIKVNAQCIMHHAPFIYNLQGRKIENRKLVNGQLSNGQLSNSKFKRGLYIIDGHKVMVK
jgi:hypothetical protein